MARIEFDERELRKLDRLITSLPDEMQRKVWRPSFGAAARVIAKGARQTDFGFEDKTGRLRASIKSGAIRKKWAPLERLKYAAGVLAGGPGARQAHLVEEGHEGPKPAPPHSFLEASLRGNITQAQNAFHSKAAQIAARVIEQAKRKFGL